MFYDTLHGSQCRDYLLYKKSPHKQTLFFRGGTCYTTGVGGCGGTGVSVGTCGEAGA
jgi:hypothetical protein